MEITHDPEWRSLQWDEDVPRRPAWFVSCPDHPNLGKDWSGNPWGYASEARAKGVYTRHLRAYHVVKDR